MGTIGNHNGHGLPGPSRRWDPDLLTRRPPRPVEATYSGRRFVVGGVVGVFLIWGLVYLGFLAWRADYRERAAFGATQIAPLVDPLADLTPPDVDPTAWRSAVADTHGMLLVLTGSGLLDRPMLEALRTDLTARVARSNPGTVRHELTDLWVDLTRKAGPAIAPDTAPPPGSRHAQRNPRPPWPELLRPPPVAGVKPAAR